MKPIPKKGKRFIQRSTARINIAHGAVRSGKTIDCILAWLGFIARSGNDDFLQTGKTRTSLYRNVLKIQMSLLDYWGIDYNYRPGDGYLEIEDKTVWLMGFHNESVTEIIRGMTLGGWYGNEANTYPKSAVEESLDRMSLEDARAFWDMNPESPYHYINLDYITNQSLLEAGFVRAFHFTLYDNPYLDKSYIALTEKRYPPGTIGNKRKIWGLWVIAEGVIYNRFVEANNTFARIPYGVYKTYIRKDPVTGKEFRTVKLVGLDYDYYVIGTDWGSGNVTVFGLFGIKRNPTGNEYHLLDEYYHDATQDPRGGLETHEYANNALNLLNFRGFKLPLKAFFTPHDASSLRNTLRRSKYLGKPIKVMTHTPDVIKDIDEIKPLISNQQFLMNVICENSIAQAQTYAWDPKAQRRGEDSPLKTAGNDHCPDMWRGPLLGTRNMSKHSSGPYKTSDDTFDYVK